MTSYLTLPTCIPTHTHLHTPTHCLRYYTQEQRPVVWREDQEQLLTPVGADPDFSGYGAWHLRAVRACQKVGRGFGSRYCQTS